MTTSTKKTINDIWLSLHTVSADSTTESFLPHSVAVLFVIIVMLASTVSVGAQCTFVGQLVPRSINDPYEYSRTVIDSLSFAHQATQGITSGTSETWQGLMTNLKRARDDYKCAASIAEKFQSSNDMWIKRTASSLSVSYSTMAEHYQKEVTALTQYLNKISKGQTPPTGSTLDSLTDLGRAADKSLEILGQAAGQAVTFPLVEWTDQTSQAKQTGRLQITESQRQTLLKQIEKNFGSDTIKRGPTEGPQPILELGAIAIYQWLSDRKYRSADQHSP